MSRKEGVWRREYKGLTLHSWIALAGMMASIAYYIPSRLLGWGSLEPIMALIAASTYFTVSYLGGYLRSVDGRLLEIRDLVKEVAGLLRGRGQ